jgi:MFS family permease
MLNDPVSETTTIQADTPDTPDTRDGSGPADAGRVPFGRPFLVVWAGQTVSAIGSTVGGIGIAVWVYVSTGSAVWLGLLSALAGLPAVLAAPLSHLADRYDRRRVMIVADIVAVSGTLVALVAALADRLTLGHLAVAAVLGGLGTAVQVPAYQAALPHLVPPGAIARANGLVQLGPAAGIVIGPLVATPLVAWWGIGAVLAVDVASFAVGVGATVLTRFRAPAAAGDTEGYEGWTAGIRWLRTDGRALLGLLGLVAVVNLVLAFFNVSMLAAAADLGGTARAGWVPAVAGIGMIVGSLAVAQRGLPERRRLAVAGSLALFGLGALLAARPSFVLLVAGVTVAIASVPMLNAVTATTFHEQVPDVVRARVFGVRASVGRALDPFGAAVAGVVVAHLAAPAVAEGGALSSTLGRLTGTGADRGAAAVLALVGLALVALAVVVVRHDALRALDPAAGTVERNGRTAP